MNVLMTILSADDVDMAKQYLEEVGADAFLADLKRLATPNGDERVLAYLENHRWSSAAEVARGLDMDANYVRGCIRRLVNTRQLVADPSHKCKGGNKYATPPPKAARMPWLKPSGMKLVGELSE